MNPQQPIGLTPQQVPPTMGYKSIMGIPYARTIQYGQPQASQPPQQTAFSLGVPAQYASAVDWSAQHAGIPIQTYVKQLNVENGGKWDANLVGVNPRDIGPSQLNQDYAIPDITGKSTRVNWFKQATGHDFNIQDPNDLIKGSAVYMNLLRQQQLPAAGITNPTEKDVIGAYHVGAKGYAKDPTAASTYLDNVYGTSTPQIQSKSGRTLPMKK